MVPAMLETLLAAGQAHHETLRVLQYGGAPVRPGTLRRTYEAMPGVRMLNMFGQTEGSPSACSPPRTTGRRSPDAPTCSGPWDGPPRGRVAGA